MARTELHFAMSQAIADVAKRILFKEAPKRQPEHGFIGVIYRSSGIRRTSLLLREIINPEPGDVFWKPGEGLIFSTAYKSRALDVVSSLSGAGLIFIHTHPIPPGSSHAPRPSKYDLDADRRDLFFLGQSLQDHSPLAAGIVGKNGLWSVREYTFSFPTTKSELKSSRCRAEAGNISYATAIRIVGNRLIKLPTEIECLGPAGASGYSDILAQDSSIKLWGEDGQKKLASMRVGLTGLGGVGGILAEHLARMGIGELIHIDFDRIKEENRNRSQGAKREEARVRALKVDVATRVAKESATAPNFSVEAVRGSIVEARTIPHLLDCDIILNGADSPWGRQILNLISYAHLIPVINGGTELRGGLDDSILKFGKSDVNTSGPQQPCLQCAGAYSIREVTEAQEHPNVRGERGYINSGAESIPTERAPSVISNNALVAAIMQLRLQAIVLGTTPETTSGNQRFYVMEGILAWSPIKSCKPECKISDITAQGDSFVLPTGIDLDYEVARQEHEEFIRSNDSKKLDWSKPLQYLWRRLIGT